MRAIVAMAIIGFVATGIAWGALSAGQKMAAQDLIKQLSSNEFKDREAAVEKLVALGPNVLELVNPLLKSTDEELRMRAEMIVKRIQEANPEGAAEGASVELNKFDPVTGSFVTMKMKDGKFADVMERIAKQTGQQVPTMPENWGGGKPVTVDFDKTPYWEALDKVCEPQGLVYIAQFNNKGLQLVEVKQAKPIATCYAGAMVFKVVSLTRTRTYYGAANADSIQCQIWAAWDEQLKPAWGEQPALEKATDEKGTELKQANLFNMQPRGVFGRHQESGVRGQAAMTTFYVWIGSVPGETNKFGELTGNLTAGFGEGTQEMTIADPFGPGDKSGKVGGYELTVKEAKEVGTQGALMAVITKDGKPAGNLNFGGDERYGIWVEEQEHKKFYGEIMPEGQSWQWAGSPKPPAAAPVNPAVPAVKAAPTGLHQIMFHGMPPEGEDIKLIWSLPKETKTQAYRFQFKDLSAQ